MVRLIDGPDGKSRCKWSGITPEFINYHDEEWGFPVDDDYRLFEKICLEGFQSGLSWRTILAKREKFRSAFHQFNFDQVANFEDHDVENLLQNEGIVRHRGKIEAVINNAKQAQIIVRDEGSLAKYFWSFEQKPDENHIPQTASTSEQSIRLSKDLKKRGWKFVGPTTVYAFMQAMGLINDHAVGCLTRSKVEKARKTFIRP